MGGFFRRTATGVSSPGTANLDAATGDIVARTGDPALTQRFKIANAGSATIGGGNAAAAALLTVEGVLALYEQTVIPPGAPHADNYGRLYAKNDNQLYFLDDAGLETQLTTPGGGPPTGGGWSDTGSDVQLTTATDRVGIGGTSTGPKLEIRGTGTTSATYALNAANQSLTSLLSVRDDGLVTVSGILNVITALHFNGSPIFSSGNVFVDNETPAGVIDGLNASFTLAFTPLAGTLMLFLNGILLKETDDYTRIGTALTLLASSIPTTGSNLIAAYRK